MTVLLQTLALGGNGPLAVVKDVIDIAGVPTTAASRALAHAPPAVRNADVVDALLAAGYRIIGKANLHELAFGATGINQWTGTPVNPLDERRVPGGSSSGSAVAVATHLCDVSLGTDTGGSVRVPAACCGVFGLKPTFGRVSRRGALPAESTLDCIGPMARDAAGIIAAMAALDPPFTLPRIERARIGVVHVDAEPLIVQAVHAAIAASALPVSEVRLPHLEAAFNAALAIINAESSAAFGHLLDTGELGADVATRLRRAASTSAQDVIAANEIRRVFTDEVDALLRQVDVLALPTLPILPPLIAEAGSQQSGIALTALARPFNLSGHPAISVPVPSSSTLPVGLQLVGRRGEDELVCALAARIHAAMSAIKPRPGRID